MREEAGQRRGHPRFARLYPRLAGWAEANGLAQLRAEALAPARGRVLEVGAGHGLNFAHYPRGVDEVVAIEPEPALRALAEQAAARAPVPISVLDGTAEDLPAPDGSFDTAVSTLVLCSVRDLAAALGEIRRVLRPDGHFCFLEHLRAESAGFARYQRVVELVWPRISGGCHLTRELDRAVPRAGFAVERLRRFRFPPRTRWVPSAPTMLGCARPHGT